MWEREREQSGGRQALKIPLAFVRAWIASLHCLTVICFLLLQRDGQGRCVLTWSNAVCSCGNEVSFLLFNGHVTEVVKSWTLGAVCSSEQHPSNQHPHEGCPTPLCTQRRQPCLVFHTVPTINHPIRCLSRLFYHQRPITHLVLLQSSQSGWSLYPSPVVITTCVVQANHKLEDTRFFHLCFSFWEVC